MMIVLAIQIHVHHIPVVVDQMLDAPEQKLVKMVNAKVFEIQHLNEIFKKLL